MPLGPLQLPLRQEACPCPQGESGHVAQEPLTRDFRRGLRLDRPHERLDD